MSIRRVLDLRARCVQETEEARAEKLKEAIQFARSLGYKRVTWKLLERLGYDTKELGRR